MGDGLAGRVCGHARAALLTARVWVVGGFEWGGEGFEVGRNEDWAYQPAMLDICRS